MVTNYKSFMLTGLILTDTRALAAIMNEPQERVCVIINRYIARCTPYINWYLVDISDAIYAGLDTRDWHACATIINDYYCGLGLESVNCPLFILGGDDVIPMPRIENPITGVGNRYLHADFLYCFEKQDSVHLDYLFMQTPRFAVGRLPLPLKQYKDNLGQQDLVTYLDTCADLIPSAISVDKIMMTTAESFYGASVEMMKDLQADNETVVVSPSLDLEQTETRESYLDTLRQHNFVLFDLHGSDRQSFPYFVGENKSRTRYPIALAPSLISYGSPHIFNTIACFGARFVGYDIDLSMLRSALAGGTMLYCGSCDTAIGGIDKMFVATSMMSFYNIYLSQGYPSGMALTKAKQDYFISCAVRDGFSYAMYTILEFNLFGCPILSMRPRLSLDYRPAAYNRQPNGKDIMTYHPEKAQVLYKATPFNKDVRDLVRKSKDIKLEAMCTIAENAIYQYLNYGSVALQQVIQVSQDTTNGYRFIFTLSSQNGDNSFEISYIVSVDSNGNVLSIVCTN